jgi:formate C-acetyltransferase
MNPRIEKLREQVMKRHGSFVTEANPYERDVATLRSYQSDGNGGINGQAQARGLEQDPSRIQQRAAYLYELVKVASLEIPPFWNLAGEHLPTAAGAVGMGGFGMFQDDDPERISRLAELGVEESEIPKLENILFRGARTFDRESAIPHQYYSVGEISPENNMGRGNWGQNNCETVFWGGGWVENHSIRDFAKVIRIGFRGIRAEIEAEWHKHDITEPDYAIKENFWKAALRICDAGILLGQRYAELATEKVSQTSCDTEKKRFEKMAEVCRKAPAEGAGNFFEAVQTLWFAHILTCGEDGINANSIGRLDQILYPYYRDDNISRDEALEIMEELACKLYLDYDVQAITLAGVDKEGNDAVNELSYLILEATGNVDFIRDVSVRLSDNTPDDFIDLCSRLIIKGGGIPFIFNDNCFVKALNDRGIKLEDARDYAPIGCIELTIPGKANPHAVSGWMNSTKCLELALFGGVEQESGRQIGPKGKTLAEMDTFEEFFDAYKAQLEYFAKSMVYNCNRGELKQREQGPLPCWSVMTDDCIKRGRDITDQGAVYNYHSICFMGTANTADSLMAVKKLVFEDKSIEPSVLLEALKNNFENHDALRARLLNSIPKYGNDNPEVDQLAKEVDEHFIAFMDQFESPLGGKYFVHLFSFLCNLTFGKATGATPDGRKAGEPIAYSLSAQQGRDEKGITAMLKSLSCLPHDQAAGSSAAIVELSPKLIDGASGKDRMNNIIKTAMDLGVGQLQFNVVTVDRLVKAQEDPEKFGNIPVRVAGFSQMFKLIAEDLQNHIIARTKHEN